MVNGAGNDAAATRPRGRTHTRYICPICKKQMVHKKGRGWVHRQDNTPCTYHVMQLRLFPPEQTRR